MPYLLFLKKLQNFNCHLLQITGGALRVNCLFQLLQVYQAKLNYLSWENLIEWITYVASLLLVIDFEVCQRETGYRQVRPHLKGGLGDGRKVASFILFSYS